MLPFFKASVLTIILFQHTLSNLTEHDMRKHLCELIYIVRGYRFLFAHPDISFLTAHLKLRGFPNLFNF